MDRDLTAISRFQVDDNQLTLLPAEIGRLTQLEWLSVRNSN
jgi:Leucine-rich repeat (LRR) protein